MESVKGGIDLVDDKPFKKCVFCRGMCCTLCLIGYREDVITLQNPHGLPSLSAAKVQDTQKGKMMVSDKPAVAGPVAATQNAATPCTLRSPFPSRELTLWPREHFPILFRCPWCVTDVHVC